ncbi:hypothetical protein Bca52824_077632 [Brassica carinata]|uniref:Uncharacterized protein n=1 Tax=Brassica carinata TaxID=52824 RepID=A0A8X7PWF2_BRACI|nr:hypothetical protein Bca52824_077632 [Brassica carinata]
MVIISLIDRNYEKKRKKPLESKESSITEEENGLGSKSSTDDSVKSSGFRQIGSRRKNKPRRAAEAVVECNDGV